VASRRKKKLKQAQEDAKKGMQTSFDDPCRTGKSKRKRRKGLKRKEKEGKGRKRKEKEGKGRKKEGKRKEKEGKGRKRKGEEEIDQNFNFS